MRNFISIIELMERAMRAPDFNQWFEGSVVVDEKGQPLRCYHGSFSAFDECSSALISVMSKQPTSGWTMFAAIRFAP